MKFGLVSEYGANLLGHRHLQARCTTDFGLWATRVSDRRRKDHPMPPPLLSKKYPMFASNQIPVRSDEERDRFATLAIECIQIGAYDMHSWKTKGATAVLFTLVAVAAANPAYARLTACTFKAMTSTGATYLAETATGLRRSAACRRARRQCQRRLRRIRRLPRGITGCVPLATAGNPQPARGPKRTNGGPSKPRPGTSKPPSQ